MKKFFSHKIQYVTVRTAGKLVQGRALSSLIRPFLRYFLHRLSELVLQYSLLQTGGMSMRRICGLMLFCFASGMAVLLFIPETIFTILFIVGCLILGYNLFCC